MTSLSQLLEDGHIDRIAELLRTKYEFTQARSSSANARDQKLALDVAKRLSPKRTLHASVLAGVPYLAEHARQTCAPRPKCTKCPLVSFCATGITTLVKLPRTQPIVVDLFGGAGGLGFGFRQAKYRIGLAVELDRNAAQTYRFNNPGVPVLELDVAKLTARSIRQFIGRKPDIVCAGPPCQSYSIAGHRHETDPRHNLFKHVLSLANEIRPKMVVIENVPGISRSIGLSSYKEKIAKAIGKQFDSEILLLTATSYGVPQLRRRYFFIGRPKGTPELGKPRATHSEDGIGRTKSTPRVLEVLRHLPKRNHGSLSDAVIQEGKVVRNLSTMLHSKRVVKKIKKIRAGDGPISYRRVHKDFARTIVAGHRALPVHPTRNRTLSSREAAALQGFCDEYAFLGSRGTTPLQVANAVPPPVAFALARHIRRRLVTNGSRRK